MCGLRPPKPKLLLLIWIRAFLKLQCKKTAMVVKELEKKGWEFLLTIVTEYKGLSIILN